MQSIQAQIVELNKSSAPATNAAPAVPPAVGNASQTPSETTQPGQNAANPADDLKIAPKRNAVGAATASYQADSQDQIAAPRIDNAPLDPRYPGCFRLPGTQTLMRIGGFFKTDFIYDLKPAGDPERFIPATFPIPAPPVVNNTTVSIRPTRMNLDFLVPVNSSSVRFFMEFDLFGSNATTPRLRHAYAQAANFLAGQSFSNFMNPDAGPDTLESEGPNSQVNIRNPQLRYSVPLAEKTILAFSLERASSDLSFKTPEFSSLPNSPSPDGAVKFRHEFALGHVQLATVMRSPSAYLADGRIDSVFGWGMSLSGALKVAGTDTLCTRALTAPDTSGMSMTLPAWELMQPPRMPSI